MRETEDHVVGVLLGLAAGDRIGGPVRMALRLAESLRDRAGFDRHDISARYLDWWREGAFDTGPTAARVLALGASGMLLEEAAIQVNDEAGGLTAGCNPAHRGAPLSMLASLEDSQLDQAAKAEASLTHWHPLAGDVAAAVVVLCRALIRGAPWRSALHLAAASRLAETRRAIEGHSADELSRGGFAPDVLRAAVHFLDTSPSFLAALERSTAFAGPSNYSPVLGGSIGGARWGRAAIPESEYSHHSDLVRRLRTTAADLASGWASAEVSLNGI